MPMGGVELIVPLIVILLCSEAAEDYQRASFVASLAWCPRLGSTWE
jgi:hypothetical protein